LYLNQAPQEADGPRFRGHPVELEAFQGPLDLLLHLIKKDEVEIWEIEISRITRQYLEYLATLRSLNIEVAGEFLVMAATLMRIKSQNLLPRPSFLTQDEEGEEPLTRDGLIARLVEYKRFREAARAMARLEQVQNQMHPVGAVAALGPNHVLPLREPKLLDLVEYFREMLTRAEPVAGHEVHLEEVKLEEQMEWILERLAAWDGWEEAPELERPGLTFRGLLRRPSLRLEIAVTFLACLELAKHQRLRLWQRRALEELWILPRGPEENVEQVEPAEEAAAAALAAGADAPAVPVGTSAMAGEAPGAAPRAD